MRPIDYRRRRTHNRETRKKIVIVCEGEKTEIRYFRHLNSRYGPVQVIPVHGNTTDPKGIVRYANRMKREHDIDTRNGDGVWCVYDADENTDHVLSEAYSMARRHEIDIALSNPSFELWVLLHFKKWCWRTHRDEALREVTNMIPKYRKSHDVYPDIENLQEQAMTNAKELVRTHTANGIDLHSQGSNPCSTVYELIEVISSIRSVNSQR